MLQVELLLELQVSPQTLNLLVQESLTGLGLKVELLLEVYLRKRVLKLVFLSQFPYKFVNLCGE